MLLSDILGRSPTDDYIAVVLENPKRIIIYDQFRGPKTHSVTIPLNRSTLDKLNSKPLLIHGIKISKEKLQTLNLLECQSPVKELPPESPNTTIKKRGRPPKQQDPVLTIPEPLKPRSKYAMKIKNPYKKKTTFKVPSVIVIEIEQTPMSPETLVNLLLDIKKHLSKSIDTSNAVYSIHNNTVSFQNGRTKNINETILQELWKENCFFITNKKTIELELFGKSQNDQS